MPINFIPNDPRASAPAMREQAKRADRPSSKSGFTFSGSKPEGKYNPGTPQFLFWQCREAALAAMEAWEASAGVHTKWQGNRKKLPLRQDAGDDLNAFYDRASFSFFHKNVSGTTFLSGQSTDVVAHEIGHGLLDSVRQDFFDVNFLEVGAFHEAFGDCMAMLTALNDKETRQKLLAAAPNLRKRNFVESTAEDLSAGIKMLIPGHNAAEPRHAFNTFQFQLPQTLPDNGGPGELIDEVHSFGMIFTGCLWDLIANIFGAAASKTEAALQTAARTAGEILIAGSKVAVVTPRFLQSVGRAMLLADQSQHANANRPHILDAFQRHGIQLGTGAMMTPSMALEGAAPKAAAIGGATRKDLLRRLGSRRGAKLGVAGMNVFGTRMVNAVHKRDVSLADVGLKGVVAVAHESVMVGASGGKAALVGNLPHPADTESEVLAFVKSLLAHGRIDLGGKATGKKGLVAAPAVKNQVGLPTHTIKTLGGKKTLVRIRFQCGCV